jgi:hypothetical protein
MSLNVKCTASVLLLIEAIALQVHCISVGVNSANHLGTNKLGPHEYASYGL